MGISVDAKYVNVELAPLQILPVEPARTSPTTFCANTGGFIFLNSSSPLKRVSKYFWLAVYGEVGGSLYFPELLLMLVSTAPVTTVRTLMPNGVSSSLSTSSN